MSTFYQVGYSDFIVEHLPPDKRINYLGDQNKMVNWLQALIGTPVQYINDLTYTDVAIGASYLDYDSGTTYGTGAKVKYNHAIYESLVDSNIGNTPSDLNSTYWFLRQPNCIGIDERVQYNASTIILTYALNKWFSGVFLQPPGVSDIYITTNSTIQRSLTASYSDDSSFVFETTSVGFVDTGASGQFQSNADYTIHFPTAIHSAIPGGDDEIMRFVDQYNTAGITYEITTY